MSRATWESDRVRVETVLRSGTVIYLALANDDVPYVLPLSYGYRNGSLFMHCGLHGRKVDMLRRNPRVAFFVDTNRELVMADVPCAISLRFHSVMGSGTAVLSSEREDLLAGYKVLLEQHGIAPKNYKEQALEKSLIIRIDIEDAQLRSKGLAAPASSI